MKGSEGSELSPEQEDRLRLALGIIGEEAGRPEPGRDGKVTPLRRAAEREGRRSRWRRPGTYLGVVAVAASVALVVTLTVGGDQLGGAMGSGASAKQAVTDSQVAPAYPEGLSSGGRSAREVTDEEWVACARFIGEGDIVTLLPGSGEGRVRLTLDLTDRIKPERGDDRVELDLPLQPGSKLGTEFRTGDNLLIVVPADREVEADVFHEGSGERSYHRRLIDRILDDPGKAECSSDRKKP
ncbi:hypothetical protein ABT354_12680 [Streptomyces sp. NPDC000594]|uniref:hypothetical protein n=1 Tax=Streptomyces sp. NPDC000594 TaxID=3154261 RepID=UPI0033206209